MNCRNKKLWGLLVILIVALGFVKLRHDTEFYSGSDRSQSDVLREFALSESAIQVQKEELPETNIGPVPITSSRVVQVRKEQIDTRHQQRHEDDPRKIGTMVEGKVSTSSGEVLFQASEKLPIVSAKSLNGAQWVLVNCGDARAYLINLDTKASITLPSQTPGQHEFPLSWSFIDQDTLLGVGGRQKLLPDGSPVNTDDNVAETYLYIYRISEQRREKLLLPEELNSQGLTISDISRDGSIRILLNPPPDDSLPSVERWYRLSR